MHYLTELSAAELQTNFELANEHLKQIFSTYPLPKDMEACPCCIHEYELESLKKGDLYLYLCNAMYTWGEENDFKHYIPRLFSFVYLENETRDTFILLDKLNYVENWTQEEIQAIFSWFSAYSLWKYVGDLKTLIERSCLKAQSWLDGHTDELSCDFPFSVFLELEFDEMIPFLASELVEKFAELLDIWPMSETDFVVYAWCLINYRRFSDGEYGIFEKRAPTWISKNEKIMEELFWKTEDSRLQQLFSDALSHISL